MLPSKKNTLSLRLAAAGGLLLVFVAILFGALVSAVSSARDADRDATRSRQTITALASARQQVVGAHAADPSALKRVDRAVASAASAVEASPYLTARLAAEIRAAADAFDSDPAALRADLTTSLTTAINAQDAASARHSKDLDSALTRAIFLGLFGLAGILVTLLLFGADVRRSVLEPLRNLITGSRRLGGGDLSTRVPEAGVDDLKAVARALNSMAVSLQATRKTLDTQHAQIASSRAETDRATTAKNEFLSRMSHELRTPLNAILGFAQLLELDDLDARQRDNVAHIVSGGRHLLDLINEVLEISRIETGSMNPVIEPVNAFATVQEAIELVSPLAAQRGIVMNAPSNAHAGVWIAADLQRFKQILLNLLANAVKYNRDGGSVSVSIKTLGDRARIEVTDTGLGIPQDQLPKLFIPFERLGAESTGVEGTGLGLVLALRLAEAMNGTLGVESQPWIGSTFHIELPLAQAPAPTAVELPSRLDPAADHGSVAVDGQVRVLYIEDDAANTHLMAQLFAEEPRLDLLTTMYGKLGLELARQHQPDLILLDVHLPDMGGDEVLTRLRSDELTRAIPVIAVSADATEEQRGRMTALGAANYLTKPLTLNMVLGAVWGALDRPMEAQSA
jgi:signal transduction histidine kinase/ActR/RegA family two-component response regulator